ncbi:hypothetical protein [Paenibacillus tyrfis]|nr:hypothetical protein [Paenibacillus tyrfis]
MKKAIFFSIILFLSLSGSFYNTPTYPIEKQTQIMMYSEVDPGY